MNPIHSVIKECIDHILPYLSKGQLIILRSSVSPNTTEWLNKYIAKRKKDVEECIVILNTTNQFTNN